MVVKGNSISSRRRCIVFIVKVRVESAEVVLVVTNCFVDVNTK